MKLSILSGLDLNTSMLVVEIWSMTFQCLSSGVRIPSVTDRMKPMSAIEMGIPSLRISISVVHILLAIDRILAMLTTEPVLMISRNLGIGCTLFFGSGSHGGQYPLLRYR
jgi:hypothetical protein